jgi:hypothetical protein
MGETRVDLLHLLEDLRDAYPASLDETILTEIVANSLDSGAASITVRSDAATRSLTVGDDGTGMSRQSLSRYHDLAATSKRRGRSIGFAGVGIKLGLLVSEEVVTETRRKRTHLATSWRLASKNRAPWRWIEPPGYQAYEGTTVRLQLANALSELLDTGFVEAALLRSFQPLFDPAFDGILAPHYPRGVLFVVNGRVLPRTALDPERAVVEIKARRERKPSGVGYLSRGAELGPDERGIAVSTLGKVIKRGWDWLGVAPADPDLVTGLVEVPALVEALTLNKSDFIRTGARGAIYVAYRKALQEAVSARLAVWGDAPRPTDARTPRTRALERDLRAVLANLSSDFPLLSALVDRRPGGQRRLPLGTDEPHAVTEPAPRGETAGPTTDSATEPEPLLGREEPAPPPGALNGRGAGGLRKPAHFGLAIRFENRPDDAALGKLVESTLWVNEAHPAYRRAAASRSEGYHIALTAAMTLAPLAVGAEQVHDFVNAFLRGWGVVRE